MAGDGAALEAQLAELAQGQRELAHELRGLKRMIEANLPLFKQAAHDSEALAARKHYDALVRRCASAGVIQKPARRTAQKR